VPPPVKERALTFAFAHSAEGGIDTFLGVTLERVFLQKRSK
jgi:hypothetical protein